MYLGSLLVEVAKTEKVDQDLLIHRASYFRDILGLLEEGAGVQSLDLGLGRLNRPGKE